MRKHHGVRSKGESICHVSAILFLCFGGGLIVYTAILVIMALFTRAIPATTTLFMVGLALISVGLGCKAIEMGQKSDRTVKIFLDKMDELETNVLTKMKMLEESSTEIKGKKSR